MLNDDYTRGWEPGGCFTAILAIAIAVGGLFLPWPLASVGCGMLAAVLFIKAFMQGMNG